jgi:hypothetical protein
MDLRKGLTVVLCVALGTGAGFGAAACGQDDERGGVEVQDGTGASTTGTEAKTTTTP